jgi:hypothetical protein
MTAMRFLLNLTCEHFVNYNWSHDITLLLEYPAKEIKHTTLAFSAPNVYLMDVDVAAREAF